MTREPARLVLVGHPVRHSLSPLFQNAALRRAGIALTYEVLDVRPSELPGVMAELRAIGAAGNVTIPHKETAAAICDVLTADARRVGAVNTFWVEGGALVGDNTDVGGFEAAARRLLGDRVPPNADGPMHRSPDSHERARDGGASGASPPAPGVQVALLGAGGAAAAVLGALERWAGVRVTIHNRTTRRASALARRFAATVAGSAGEAVRGADLVVNATPIGMADDAHPIDVALLDAGTAVLDLVYRRGGTPWVLAARARGLAADDGLAMLIEQGALAFRRWFGMDPDRQAMWRAVE